MAGTLTPTPYQTVLDDDGVAVSGAKIYTYEAGTTTNATTYTTSALNVANANPIVADSAGRYVAYLAAGANLRFIIKTSADVTIDDQDNILSVPGTSVNLDVEGTVGEAVVAGQVLYMSSGAEASPLTAGLWYLTDADAAPTSTTAQTIGVAVSAIAINTSGTIRLAGVVPQQTAVVVGTTYYVSATAGAVTASAPTLSRQVGVAMTTSSLLLAAGTRIVGSIPNPITQDLLFTDNTYDIGKAGATRPRDVFASRNAVVGGDLTVGSTDLVVDTSENAVVVGHSAIDGRGRALEVLGTTSNASGAELMRFSANAEGPSIALTKSRGGAIGTEAIVQDDDALGTILWLGDDGTDQASYAAQIAAAVDGTPGSNDMPGRLVFSTTADGAASPTAAMTIDSSQDVTIVGDLVVSGTGPHAIGGSTLDYVRLGLTGAFTSGGASTVAIGTLQDGVITGHSGDSGGLFGTRLANQFIAAGDVTGSDVVAQLFLSEPTLTTGGNAIANTATLYIEGAATEGTADYALWVNAGATKLGGTLDVTGATTLDSTLSVVGAVTINDAGADIDTRIESDDNQNMVFVDGGEDRIGIGTGAPQALLDVTIAGQAKTDTGGVFSYLGKSNESSNYASLQLFAMGGSAQADRKWKFQTVEAGVANAGSIILQESGGTVGIGTATAGSTLTVNGSVSKSSGSFRIDHPLPAKQDTHHLVHSFIEGPRCDLIYRGTVTLVDGTADVDLDDAAGMSTGTWATLCRDEQCYTSNETGWHHVRGAVTGSTLTIDCEEATCTDTVSWMVVAERQDTHIMETDWTDEDGHVIVEPEKPAPDPE